MMNAIVVGAAGRMGRMIVRAINDAANVTCRGAVEIPGHPTVGSDAGEVAGLGKLGVQIGDDLAEVIHRGDVVIDFTSAASSVENMKVAADHEKPMVVGSTGFSPEQRQQMRELARQVPCVLSPNMSVGVNVMFRVVQEIARVLGDDYDVEIVEAHHRLKKDAPSGTALRLGELLAHALDRKWEEVGTYTRKGAIGERTKEEIGMQVIRAGDIVGDHTVIFGGIGERLEVTHRAHTRDNFARGALRAAAWVGEQNPGLYDMADVLGLK